MNAYLSEYRHGQATSALPPILIVGDSELSLERAAASVEASGLRIAGRALIENASHRMDQQVASSALWIEVERDGGSQWTACSAG
jgi:hypothetical protein